MRFLIDANLPRSIIPMLVRLGQSAEHVNDVGLEGAPDEQIAARARETLAVIVTRDLDFADVRTYPPADYQGIVVLRLPDDANAMSIVQIFERFIAQTEIIKQLPGRLAILESDHFRLRPALLVE